MKSSTVESVKDEVAKAEHGNDLKWGYLSDYQRILLIPKIAELYHTRKLEEAGQELPTEEQWKVFCDSYVLAGESHKPQMPSSYKTYEWMYKQASILLASKQEKVENLNKNLNVAVSQGERLKSQLQEAKSANTSQKKQEDESPLSIKLERRFIERCESIGMPFSELTGDENRIWECAIASMKEVSIQHASQKEKETDAVEFAKWLFAHTDWRTKNFKILYIKFKSQQPKKD